jgi:hypothetical protein
VVLGFAAALAAFAVTLKLTVFIVILSASVVLFWISSAAMKKK